MLTLLRIKDLALAADLTVEFDRGYNAITGETGAGKSMLIGGLNLVLGQRADRTLIRAGAESCSVEGVFELGTLAARVSEFLEANGLESCEDGQLVVKRTFTAAGTNRQFINGSPTTLAVLSAVGEWLVDIHGPHEHQSLLHPGHQLAMLDAYGKLEGEREAFAAAVRERVAVLEDKARLVVDEQTYAQQLDLLRFQTQEIAAARLQAGEEEQVTQEHARAANASRLLELSQGALDALSEAEPSLLGLAGAVGRAVQELHRLDAGSAGLRDLQQQATELLRELQGELTRYRDHLEVNPERLAELEQRLNLIQSLKRKYGGSIAEVLAFGETARQRLQALESRDEELVRLNACLAELDRRIGALGRGLSGRRQKAIPGFAKAVQKELAALGFRQSQFSVAIQAGDWEQLKGADRPALSGVDRVEFEFAPNPGEPARPLRAIASSGELARVMLALKTVLAAEDNIPVVVFDEVDANVGGETANAVGQKMKRIALRRQVICITHLPQVAAPAGAHYIAEKQTRNGRTISEIRRLGGPDRVTELARMLGGQTSAARKHAEALVQQAEADR